MEKIGIKIISVVILVIIIVLGCYWYINERKVGPGLPPKTEYMTISELNDFCEVPGSCKQEMACEGKEIKVKGYVDYNNVFNKENYPQLSYEKFKIEDENKENSLEVFAVAEDNKLIFEKIHKNNEGVLRMIFVTGIIEGFDMQTMNQCKRGIKLTIDSEVDIYFEPTTSVLPTCDVGKEFVKESELSDYDCEALNGCEWWSVGGEQELHYTCCPKGLTQTAETLFSYGRCFTQID